jgi:hypothetical protein
MIIEVASSPPMYSGDSPLAINCMLNEEVSSTYRSVHHATKRTISNVGTSGRLLKAVFFDKRWSMTAKELQGRRRQGHNVLVAMTLPLLSVRSLRHPLFFCRSDASFMPGYVRRYGTVESRHGTRPTTLEFLFIARTHPPSTLDKERFRIDSTQEDRTNAI